MAEQAKRKLNKKKERRKGKKKRKGRRTDRVETRALLSLYSPSTPPLVVVLKVDRSLLYALLSRYSVSPLFSRSLESVVAGIG